MAFSRHRHLLVIILLVFVTFPATAQLKIVPQEKLDSIVNPVLAPISRSLSFENVIVDAGTIQENGGVRTYSFVFRNVSGKPVEITRVLSNCACAVAHPSIKTVQPGEQAVIRVVYDPKGHPGTFVRRIRVYAAEEGSKDQAGLAAFLKLKVHVVENMNR